MAPVSAYLASNNLHFKPICARLGRGFAWTTTTLQKSESLRVFSKPVFIFGAVVCLPIALIESVCLFVIAGLAVAINRFLCQNHSEFLQKHALKALSYAVHSSVMTVAFFILGLKNPNLTYHISSAIVDNALYLGSASFAQCLFGPAMDFAAGNDIRSFITRTTNLLRDSHPYLLNDLLAQIQRDFELNFRERLGEIPRLDEFLSRHPQYRPLVTNFNFQTLINDRAYRNQTAHLFRALLADMGLVLPAPEGASALYFELIPSTEQERRYQNRLVHLLQHAFLKIHQKPALSGCLDQEGHTGQYLLEILAASTCIQLTTYAQYEEILQTLLYCPESFSPNLACYNPRREQLVAAKAKVMALSDAQKQNLEQKILRGSSYQTEGAVQEAFLAISALASDLYQGPLMTRTALNLERIQGGDIVEVRNLYQTACQGAISQLKHLNQNVVRASYTETT